MRRISVRDGPFVIYRPWLVNGTSSHNSIDRGPRGAAMALEDVSFAPKASHSRRPVAIFGA